jgi:hypothetical protein
MTTWCSLTKPQIATTNDSGEVLAACKPRIYEIDFPVIGTPHTCESATRGISQKNGTNNGYIMHNLQIHTIITLSINFVMTLFIG